MVAVDTSEPRTASVEVLGSSWLIAASIAAWWPFTASVTLQKLASGWAPRSEHSAVALASLAIHLSNKTSLTLQDSCFWSPAAAELLSFLHRTFCTGEGPKPQILSPRDSSNLRMWQKWHPLKMIQTGTLDLRVCIKMGKRDWSGPLRGLNGLDWYKSLHVGGGSHRVRGASSATFQWRHQCSRRLARQMTKTAAAM